MSIQLYNADCLIKMKDIPDKSVDMILCDLPYQITSSKWDKMIPFEPLWNEYKRIIKDRCAIVLFGAEPFSSKLRLSNIEWFKYDWIWEKNNAVGFVNAKLKPMNKHEVISVFSNGKTANCNEHNMFYFPQGLVKLDKPSSRIKNGNRKGKDNTYWRPCFNKGYTSEYTNYPTTVLHFDKVNKAVHPTQKPVELLEYLINTYTKLGGVILDNTMGSGSTGVAAVNTDRNFIGIEKDEHYFEIAQKRIDEAIKSKCSVQIETEIIGKEEPKEVKQQLELFV